MFSHQDGVKKGGGGSEGGSGSSFGGVFGPRANMGGSFSILDHESGAGNVGRQSSGASVTSVGTASTTGRSFSSLSQALRSRRRSGGDISVGASADGAGTATGTGSGKPVPLVAALLQGTGALGVSAPTDVRPRSNSQNSRHLGTQWRISHVDPPRGGLS